MITVYYARAEELVNKIGFDACLTRLEDTRKEAVLRTRDVTSQVRSLATGAILHLAVCRQLDISEESAAPFQTKKGPGGKPYLQDHPQIQFNLSHSGEYVCCAISPERIGVDIQEHVPVKKRLAERFFTERENQLLNGLEAEERELMFFRMWSIKESYIKFTGMGMKQGINTFEIDWENCCILDGAGSEWAAPGARMDIENGAEEKDRKMSGHVQAYFQECKDVAGYSFAICREKSETEVIWINCEECL